MTVRELIEALQRCDPDSQVFRGDGEYGYFNVGSVDIVSGPGIAETVVLDASIKDMDRPERIPYDSKTRRIV